MTAPLPPCESCDRPMWRFGTRPEDRIPGGVQQGAHGLCSNCYSREYMPRPTPSPEQRAGIRFLPVVPLLPRHWDPAELPCVQDPDVWFPDKGHGGLTAKKHCRTCDAIDDCREAVMDLERGKAAANRHGVYAALSPTERAEMDRAQRAGDQAVAS